MVEFTVRVCVDVSRTDRDWTFENLLLALKMQTALTMFM
jgi:hypothetical protein